MSRFTALLRRLRDWFVHLLHLDDSAHRIALGAAVGVFVAMTPTVGFQMLLVLLLLWFIPGNRAAGLPLVWISNPATLAPIYYFNYRVGVVILGRPAGVNVKAEWAAVVEAMPGIARLAASPVRWLGGMWMWLGHVWHAMEKVLPQLWLGSAIVAVAAGLVTYLLMYHLVNLYRRRLKERLHLLASLRALRARRHAERQARRGETSRPGAGRHPSKTPPEPPNT